MKRFFNWIATKLHGPLITKDFDLIKSTAELTDEDGGVFKFTFSGRIRTYGFWDNYGYDLTTGLEKLQDYISSSRLQVLVDDDDKAVPVCRVKKIEIKNEPLMKTVSYREG